MPNNYRNIFIDFMKWQDNSQKAFQVSDFHFLPSNSHALRYKKWSTQFIGTNAPVDHVSTKWYCDVVTQRTSGQHATTAASSSSLAAVPPPVWAFLTLINGKSFLLLFLVRRDRNCYYLCIWPLIPHRGAMFHPNNHHPRESSVIPERRRGRSTHHHRPIVPRLYWSLLLVSQLTNLVCQSGLNYCDS